MRLTLFLIVAAYLIAQNGGQFRDWSPGPKETRIRPAKGLC